MTSNAKKVIVELAKDLSKQIDKQENPKLEVPVRALSNVRFDTSSQKLMLGESKSSRFLFNIGHVRKFAQTVRVAAISKELLDANIHTNLRDVFYQARRALPHSNLDLVDDQSETDNAIEDLETVTGLPRELLNINAQKMGSVAGKATIHDQGDEINWAKMGSGGWSIPSNVEEITFKKVDAKFIIYMEKQAVWERLHEDKFWDKHNCLIVTSQGQTTRGIRRLLIRLNKEYKLPVLVLADFDPWGFYIYSVLKYGSINLAHESERMALSDAKFLGVTADDIEKYDLKKHMFNFKDVDLERLKQMRNYDWFKNNKAWLRQFKMMEEYKKKAEIQALSGRGIQFISQTYLPEKIKKADFLD